MSVSDIDLDADTDADSRAAHRPPSRTQPEDYNEYPGALAATPIGLLIPVDDDHQVNSTARDGGLPGMNYDKDTHVLDAVLEITPKKAGTWDVTPRGMCWYRKDGTRVAGSNRHLAIDDPNNTIDLRLKSNWNTPTGTRGAGDASIISTYVIDAAKAGHTPEDKMNYIVLGCDIDVDSDNDDTIDSSNQDGTGEDFLEGLPSDASRYVLFPEFKYGMIVAVNNDDADGDGNPDNGWDGIAWRGPNANAIEDVAPLRKGVLRSFGVSDAAVKTALDMHNLYVRVKKLSGTGAVRLFTADDPKTEIGAFVNIGDTTDDVGGQALWDRLANNDLPFLVEGLRAGEVMLACELVVNGVVIHQDVVRITVLSVDLDIDSDNNNGLDPPGRTFAEEAIEDKYDAAAPIDDRAQVGKLIVANTGDGEGDGVVDSIDGYDADRIPGNADDVAMNHFVPLVLYLGSAANELKPGVRISYDTTKLRIWKQDGDKARDITPANSPVPGDFLPPGEFTVAQLGLDSKGQTVFFVEGIGASSRMGDLRIAVELDPDGGSPAGFSIVDAVRVTVVDNISLRFEGAFQDRLATDPDPSMHPRGISGGTRALEGEPDFDRIIRFAPPVALRSHVPFTPVKVTAIVAGSLGDVAFAFGDPVIGQSVALGPASWFDGTANGPGLEPIGNFRLIIGANLLVGESITAPQGQGIEEMPAADLATKGIDPAGVLAARKKALESDYAALSEADRAGTVVGRNLKARLNLIDAMYSFFQQNLAFLVSYPGTIDKNISVSPGMSPALAVFKAASIYELEMEFFSWDYDGLTGRVSGLLKTRP